MSFDHSILITLEEHYQSTSLHYHECLEMIRNVFKFEDMIQQQLSEFDR